MSMLSEQAQELRKLADGYRKNECEFGFMGTDRILDQAADTIEALSSKLAAANMERSDRYYKVRKELVEQHNKAFELINKMPLEGNEAWHGYIAEVMQTLGYLIDCMDNSEPYRP